MAREWQGLSPGSTQALGGVPKRDPASQGDATPSKPLPSKTRSVQDLTKRQITETGGELAEEEVPQSRRESRPRLKYVVMDEDDLERCFCRLPISRNVICGFHPPRPLNPRKTTSPTGPRTLALPRRAIRFLLWTVVARTV